MAAYETDPVDVPDHVSVVPLRAAFAVECHKCRVVEWLYHVTIARDRGALARAVDTHRRCGVDQ